MGCPGWSGIIEYHRVPACDFSDEWTIMFCDPDAARRPPPMTRPAPQIRKHIKVLVSTPFLPQSHYKLTPNPPFKHQTRCKRSPSRYTLYHVLQNCSYYPHRRCPLSPCPRQSRRPLSCPQDRTYVSPIRQSSIIPSIILPHR